jgi:NhaA family Na+:H+ antiporter
VLRLAQLQGGTMAAERRASRGARLAATVPRLSRFATEHLLLLPFGALVALLWANLWPESYFRLSYASAFFVNDVAMVFFFGWIGKEVVEATAPGGVLHPWRRAWLPVVAALGATVVPAWMQTVLVAPFDEPMLADAWPVAFTIDVALAYFVARLIFGARHSAIPFVIVLSIAANALGFVVLGITDPLGPPRPALAVAGLALAIAAAAGLRRAKVKSFWPYLLGPGVLAWIALQWSGLHPALALVPILPFLPHAARDSGFFVDAPPGAHDTLSAFERFCRYPAQVALLFFGLVNGGVPLHGLEAGTWALPLAVVVGRPVGLLVGVALARAIGLHLPGRLSWGGLMAIGFATASGFSVGLLFTTALMAPGQLRSEISMGVLLSAVFGVPLALAAGWLIGVRGGQTSTASP